MNSPPESGESGLAASTRTSAFTHRQNTKRLGQEQQAETRHKRVPRHTHFTTKARKVTHRLSFQTFDIFTDIMRESLLVSNRMLQHTSEVLLHPLVEHRLQKTLLGSHCKIYM